MNTVLTGKTRKANVSFRFGGLEEQGNGVLGLSSSKNFYCDNGAVRTVCLAPILLDNGEEAICSMFEPTSLRRLKRYDATGKTYSTHICGMAETGAVYGQKDAAKPVYTLLLGDIGFGDFISFTDRNFRSWAAAFGDKKCALIDDAMNAITLDIEQPSGAGCYFKHRLFVGTKPSTLVYSAVDDFTNFTNSLTEGGEISLPNCGGEIVAMRTFQDALYLFFEYGIVKMKVSGLPKEFSTEKMEYRGGKIFGRTVCVGENAVFFMTGDGLYRLDGRGVKEVCRVVVKIPHGETGKEGAAVWKGKAFIRYQTKEGVYEALSINEDGKTCFYLDDMKGLSQDEGGNAIFKSKSYNLLRPCDEGNSFNSEAVLRTVETDMGIPKRKLITKIKLWGKGFCILGICEKGKTKRRVVDFVNGYTEIRLNERGEKFSFTMDTSSAVEVREMCVEMRLPV